MRSMYEYAHITYYYLLPTICRPSDLVDMATKKTNSFYIRETIDVDSSLTVETIDLSVYVDPVNKQGLLIRQVDFIWTDKTDWVPPPAAAWQAAVQIHDTALGGMADSDQDFFPDRLGMAKGEGRICVNDTMELCTLGAGSIPTGYVCTAVLEVQVVKLSEKDYISLALQSVADA